MEGYQYLTFDIQVPSDWPVQEIRNEISLIAHNAIMRYLFGEEVIVTVRNIPALVTQHESGIVYVFKKIEEILGDTYKIDLITPSDISLIVPTREGLNNVQNVSIPLNAENLQFHLLDLKLFQTVSKDQEITIAVPNIRRILQIWQITGNNVHSCILKSTYHNIRTMEISSVLKKLTVKPDPTICLVKSAEDECKILCFDQIPKRERCYWEYVGPWMGFCAIFISLPLLFYCILKITGHLF